MAGENNFDREHLVISETVVCELHPEIAAPANQHKRQMRCNFVQDFQCDLCESAETDRLPHTLFIAEKCENRSLFFHKCRCSRTRQRSFASDTAAALVLPQCEMCDLRISQQELPYPRFES